MLTQCLCSDLGGEFVGQSFCRVEAMSCQQDDPQIKGCSTATSLHNINTLLRIHAAHKTCLSCMHAKELGNMLISNNSYHGEKYG